MIIHIIYGRILLLEHYFFGCDVWLKSRTVGKRKHTVCYFHMYSYAADFSFACLFVMRFSAPLLRLRGIFVVRITRKSVAVWSKTREVFKVEHLSGTFTLFQPGLTAQIGLFVMINLNFLDGSGFFDCFVFDEVVRYALLFYQLFDFPAEFAQF